MSHYLINIDIESDQDFFIEVPYRVKHKVVLTENEAATFVKEYLEKAISTLKVHGISFIHNGVVSNDAPTKYTDALKQLKNMLNSLTSKYAKINEGYYYHKYYGNWEFLFEIWEIPV